MPYDNEDDIDDDREDSREDDGQGAERGSDRRLYDKAREFDELRSRGQALEERIARQETRQYYEEKHKLEKNIEEAEHEARLAEEVLARAIAEANGDDAAKALRFRDDALERVRELAYRKRQADEYEENLKRAPPKKTTDPVVNKLAKGWISKNPWYDVNGGDEDSRLVLEIDTRLANEGFVPRTELYWKELDKRVRKNLPHRFEAERREEEKKRRHLERLENSTISKERKEALQLAGVWDDPDLRKKYISGYKKWDKENRTNE